MKWSNALIAAAGLLLATSATQAKQVMCVFDLVGKNGDVFTLMKDYQLAAKNWGADLELKVNSNESVIAEDFKAGKCDAVSITGMRGRQFNSFTGSLDAIGAIPDLNLAVKVMQGLANPNFAKYMTNGKYEVVGVIPVGDAFLMVNDRNINTVAKAAGKKIAVLDYDQAQKIMDGGGKGRFGNDEAQFFNSRKTSRSQNYYFMSRAGFYCRCLSGFFSFYCS
jgi:TRAP-type C4-dicarboxylate transport system substrate-binding protein